MMNTMAEWVIREPRTGPIVLWKGKERISTHPTVPEAERQAYWQMDSKQDSLVHEEPDGYRYRLRGRRRGWRAAPA